MKRLKPRADLFGLYYAADPKLAELGILSDANAYKAAYSNYIRNGLMVQLTRVELGKQITEAHMQNRKLIAEWCYKPTPKSAEFPISKSLTESFAYLYTSFFCPNYEIGRASCRERV